MDQTLNFTPSHAARMPSLSEDYAVSYGQTADEEEIAAQEELLKTTRELVRARARHSSDSLSGEDRRSDRSDTFIDHFDEEGLGNSEEDERATARARAKGKALKVMSEGKPAKTGAKRSSRQTARSHRRATTFGSSASKGLTAAQRRAAASRRDSL